MNRDNKCPKVVSFHRLPPKKPSLLHQVSFCHAFQLAYVNTTCCDTGNIDRSFQWLLAQQNHYIETVTSHHVTLPVTQM